MKKNLILFIAAFASSIISFAQESAGTSVDHPVASSENKIGGHIGVVQYIFKSSTGDNEVIGKDFYEIGFPTGITIKREDVEFDIEMVPEIDRKSNVTFLFHPGVVFPLGNEFSFGTRAAFQIGHNQYGFTPIVSKSFVCSNGQTTFIELEFPVRFSANGPMTNVVGLHLGVGF